MDVRACQRKARGRSAGGTQFESLEPRQLLSVSLAFDANPTPLSTAALSNLVAFAGKLFFTHDDGRGGAELYTSDGTEAGTALFKDIRPGAAGSAPSSLTVIDGKLYFAADDGVAGKELWVSNGTAAGTRRLTDLNTSGNSDPFGFTPAAGGGVLFFGNASGSTSGYWLYRLDPDGAVVPLKSLYSNYGYVPSHPVLFDNALYFIVGGTTAGGELWRSDGTPEGTRRVQAFTGSGSYPVKDLTAAGGKLFLNTGYKNLYVTDGSENGATLLATIGNGGTFSGGVNTGGIKDLRAAGDTVFFHVNDGTSGIELWAANATSAWRVKDIFPGTGGSFPTDLVTHEGRLYFAATDPTTGKELWTSDGTEAGTYLVMDLRSTPAPQLSSTPVNLASAGGRLWFGAAGYGGIGLYTSDGAADGTFHVRTISGPADGRAARFTLVGEDLFFTAADNSLGGELWKTSASSPAPGNTAPVKDTYPATAAALPRFIGTFQGRHYYFADDGLNGSEPRYTDGMPAGSGMLKNINPGSASSIPQFHDPRGRATSQHLFFSPVDGTTTGGTFQLWRTDGTEAGTIKLKHFNTRINSWATVNNKVYFTLDSNSTLYTSDGTPTGTVPVTNFGFIEAVHNGVMYTVRSDPTYGVELWRSDGTTPGTYRVTDINPGAGSSAIDGLTVVGDFLFFFANDGATNDSKLYRYKPSTGAVSFVKDVLPGRDDYLYGALGSAGGKFFFSATDYSTYGEEMYVSDGSPDGTRLVKDINPAGDSRPSDFITLGDAIIFAAAGPGGGLWRSDGTEAGTYPIASISPETTSIVGRTAFIQMGDHIYLAAQAHGFQGIWRTDGTPQGTLLVATVDPGGTGYTGQYAVSDGRLFFSGDDKSSGHEVWVYQPEPSSLTVSDAWFTRAAGPAAAVGFDLGRPLSLALSRGAVTVANLTTGAILKPTDIALAIDSAVSSDHLTLTFPGFPAGLPDGTYRVTLPPGIVTDLDGDPLATPFTFEFTFISGDATGDGLVNADDYHRIDRARAMRFAGWENGDFNASGVAGDADDYMSIDRAFLARQQAPAPGGAPLAAAFGAAPIDPEVPADEEPLWGGGPSLLV